MKNLSNVALLAGLAVIALPGTSLAAEKVKCGANGISCGFDYRRLEESTDRAYLETPTTKEQEHKISKLEKEIEALENKGLAKYYGNKYVPADEEFKEKISKLKNEFDLAKKQSLEAEKLESSLGKEWRNSLEESRELQKKFDQGKATKTELDLAKANSKKLYDQMTKLDIANRPIHDRFISAEFDLNKAQAISDAAVRQERYRYTESKRHAFHPRAMQAGDPGFKEIEKAASLKMKILKILGGAAAVLGVTSTISNAAEGTDAAVVTTSRISKSASHSSEQNAVANSDISSAAPAN